MELEPGRELLAQLATADQLDAAGADLPPQVAEAAPGLDEEAQVGAHHEVDVELRVLEAHLDLAVAADQPEAPAVGRRAAEGELHHRLAVRHGVRVHAQVHAPDEEGRVEVVVDSCRAPSAGPTRRGCR